MRIAMDLDDVIADLIPCLLARHHEITGATLTREQAISWDTFPPEVHDSVRYGDGYADLALLPHAAEFLRWLKQRHAVHIVTYRGSHARDMTIRWLEKHVPGLYDAVHFTGGGKVDICRELGIELIVDDSYNQVPAVTATLGIPGIIMDTAMNRHVRENALILRARDLPEARAIIEETETAGWPGQSWRQPPA